MKVRYLFTLYLLILTIILFNNGITMASGYQLSMLPRYFPEKIKGMITPLADYLSKKTGKPVGVVLTENFSDYELKILRGNIQIGYENPLVYVNVSGSHVAIATAVKGKGGDRFRGIIIVRSDSKIKNIKDLKWKKIMIVGKTSAGGFLSQKLTLKKEGIDVEHDCKLLVAARNCQENVIIAVSIGDVDAGFIRESALHKADEYIKPGSVKVLAKTAWLPNWALSVSKDMPEDDREKIKRALIELKEGDKVLKAMGLKGFKPASDSDYDIMRTILR